MGVDYLAIGHVSRDLTAEVERVGGSVSYASLTARALGLRAAVLTSYAEGYADKALAQIPRQVIPAAETTTFALEETEHGRTLRLLARAAPIPPDAPLPPAWERAPIVHLAPIAQEVASEIAQRFAGRFVGVTPQGWMRRWDESGVVRAAEWENAAAVLGFASAVVLSDEDLPQGCDLNALTEAVQVLVLTHGARGATLFWENERIPIPAPEVPAVDSTGAGDIFAAAFFIRLYHTRDPIESAHFATALAADSVTRRGLQSVPSPERVRTVLKA